MAVLQLETKSRTSRVLICGGRDFDDAAWMARVLGGLHRVMPFDVVIHGDARGADRMAGRWAKSQGIPVESYPADWNRHGRAAGAIRNQQMLDEGSPDYVIAFEGGRGTADMLRRAKLAGIDWAHHTRAAIADTHPKDGDVQQAPLVSGGGSEGNRP